MTLIPVRTQCDYQVEIQSSLGWVALHNTNCLEDALEMMEMASLFNDEATRVIEPSNGNIVDEQFPEPFIQEVETFNLDWKEHGF